ncbi:MAG: phosphopantetheine-binding protein [Pseudomonadota bacterium]
MTKYNTKEEINTQLVKLLLQNTNNDLKIDNDTTLNRFLSSLDLVEFALSIEDTFNINIESNDFRKLNTINKLSDYIKTYQNNER